MYPIGWTTRRVQAKGEFYWQGAVLLSEVLAGETIGLEPVDGRYWMTYFGPKCIGVFDSHDRRMLTKHQLRRHPELHVGESKDRRPSAALQDDDLSREQKVLPMCSV